MPTCSVVVIDANLAMQAVAPARQDPAIDLFSGWTRGKVRVVAPDLWASEVLTALRKLVFGGALSSERALRVLDDLFALGVEIIPTSIELCRAALPWAQRLGQAKCYDALYLALAEQVGAEFWTADRRLANRARQTGATWVHCLGEEGPR